MNAHHYVGLLGVLLACSAVSRAQAVTQEDLLLAATYAVSNGFTAAGTHPEGSHFHSSNLNDLPSGNPTIPVPGVAEVGGFFGDEEVRGVAEFDLFGRNTTLQAILSFDVYDVSDIAFNPIGGLFGQDPYVGTINVLGYRGNNVEEVSDYEIEPVLSLENFVVDPSQMAAGDTIEVDITDFYNELVSELLANPSTAPDALGIRLQVAPPADVEDPDTGAITFNNFRIQTVPEPQTWFICLLGLASWFGIARCRIT